MTYDQMVRTVYLDTNVFLDAFERDHAHIYGDLKDWHTTGAIQIVASELNLIEVLAGNHRPSFASGIDRLMALSPRWIHIGGMGVREVAAEYSRFEKTVLKGPVGIMIVGRKYFPSSLEVRRSISALIFAYQPRVLC
jgi:hypothetical protein